jgi:hypothetical protein
MARFEPFPFLPGRNLEACVVSIEFLVCASYFWPRGMTDDLSYSSTTIFPFYIDHDATMDNYAVEDQYCNLETGNWHEKLYLGTETCEVTWMTKWWSPIELTFTTDSCIGGFMLNSCKRGRCKSEEYYEIEEVEKEAFDSVVIDNE